MWSTVFATTPTVVTAGSTAVAWEGKMQGQDRPLGVAEIGRIGLIKHPTQLGAAEIIQTSSSVVAEPSPIDASFWSLNRIDVARPRLCRSLSFPISSQIRQQHEVRELDSRFVSMLERNMVTLL